MPRECVCEPAINIGAHLYGQGFIKRPIAELFAMIKRF